MAGTSEQAESIPTFSPSSGRYGAEVQPNGPLQDMAASIDLIAGGPIRDRTDSPANFTGGTGGGGIGGVAIPGEQPPKEKAP